MSNSFIASLKQEIFALQQDLKHDPRYSKLERLQDLLRLYEGSQVQVSPGALPETNEISPTAPSRFDSGAPSNTGRQLSEIRLKAVQFAYHYLKGRANPTPTKEILSYIQSRGVEVGGKSPVSNLSAILSKSEGFEAIGRSGWVLLPTKPQPSSESVSASNSEDAADVSCLEYTTSADDCTTNEEPRRQDKEHDDLL